MVIFASKKFCRSFFILRKKKWKKMNCYVVHGISIIEICLQYGPTLECTYGCGRNTIGYLIINVLIKSKNFMVKASTFSSIFSTFTWCTAKIIFFFKQLFHEATVVSLLETILYHKVNISKLLCFMSLLPRQCQKWKTINLSVVLDFYMKCFFCFWNQLQKNT